MSVPPPDPAPGRYLDLDQWARRPHFDFFRAFEQPYFNLCADVEVTATKVWCAAHQQSFSLACWFLCQQTVNAIEPFRYRLRGDRVWVHDQVKIGTTLLDGETFRFGYFPYAATFGEFVAGATEAKAALPDPVMDGRPEDDAIVHGSTVPWVRFTSVAHAHQGHGYVSPPRVVFGRYAEAAVVTAVHKAWHMPVSVEVHHALMDGLHVGRFFEHLEAGFADPEGQLGGEIGAR